MREFKTIFFVVLFSVVAAFGIDFLIEILRAAKCMAKANTVCPDDADVGRTDAISAWKAETATPMATPTDTMKP